MSAPELVFAKENGCRYSNTSAVYLIHLQHY